MSTRSVITRTPLVELPRWLAAATCALLGVGCERTVEAERTDVQQAEAELREVERDAAEARARADREASAERTAADRDVAAARARVAEQEREAARVDDGAPIGLDDELTRRLADLDLRIRALRSATEKVDGDPRQTADAALAKIEKRRARMQRRIEDLEDKTSAELDQAKIDLARGIRELGAEVDDALGKARASVHAM